MSPKTNPYNDNNKIESLFRLLIVEKVFIFSYEASRKVKEIPYFIREEYNEKTASSLGYIHLRNLKI